MISTWFSCVEGVAVKVEDGCEEEASTSWTRRQKKKRKKKRRGQEEEEERWKREEEEEQRKKKKGRKKRKRKQAGRSVEEKAAQATPVQQRGGLWVVGLLRARARVRVRLETGHQQEKRERGKRREVKGWRWSFGNSVAFSAWPLGPGTEPMIGLLALEPLGCCCWWEQAL